MKKTTYTVQLTDEQIALIRNLYLRIEMIWLHKEVAITLEQDGEVKRQMISTCWFCGRGAIHAEDIPHAKKCIIPLCNCEWEKMNAQFIQVIEQGEEK